MEKRLKALKRTRIRTIYRKIVSKCYNIYDSSYKYYGGQGVIICDKWLDDFEIFYKWVLPQYKDRCNITRISKKSHFSPMNCSIVSGKSRRSLKLTGYVNEQNIPHIKRLSRDYPILTYGEIANILGIVNDIDIISEIIEGYSYGYIPPGKKQPYYKDIVR